MNNAQIVFIPYKEDKVGFLATANETYTAIAYANLTDAFGSVCCKFRGGAVQGTTGYFAPAEADAVGMVTWNPNPTSAPTATPTAAPTNTPLAPGTPTTSPTGTPTTSPTGNPTSVPSPATPNNGGSTNSKEDEEITSKAWFWILVALIVVLSLGLAVFVLKGGSHTARMEPPIKARIDHDNADPSVSAAIKTAKTVDTHHPDSLRKSPPKQLTPTPEPGPEPESVVKDVKPGGMHGPTRSRSGTLDKKGNDFAVMV